jgi:hypothetical protein
MMQSLAVLTFLGGFGLHMPEAIPMKIIYAFTQDTRSQDNGPYGIDANDTAKNRVIGFTLGDFRLVVQPGPPGNTTPVEVPSKLLREPAVAQSGIQVPAAGVGDLKPNEDFLFIRDSVEYTYTTRELIGTTVIEKQMPVGAVAGMEGRMILYKGCTTLGDAIVGNWTGRLIRPFLITAADLANRQTGWAAPGSAPTVDATNKLIVDNGGDGYNHI